MAQCTLFRCAFPIAGGLATGSALRLHRYPMRATRRIEAPISQHQPFYRAPMHQMLSHNLIHICRRHMPIPDGFGIDHHRRPMLALIQASGLVCADS